jgi:predicted Zn-dependent protease with MMP-like domain
MIDVPRERFEQLVADALDGIPEELGEFMENVAVFVEERPPEPNLLGLYQGVPLTARGISYSGTLPDRISIYRRTICAICSSEDEVVEQVRRTVIHEVGHHFGIGDRRLRELGW